MNQIVGEHPPWLALDNSAKIWPAVLSKRYTTLFRLSATLDHPVKLSILENALADTMTRFPYFNVQIRRGFFWYFLEQRSDIPHVERETSNPCMDIRLIGKGCWPFHVRAFNRRISVEFSHIITDGTGALAFLRSLITRYFEHMGIDCSLIPGLARYGQQPDPREWEDSHLASVVQGSTRLPKIRTEEDAFHLTGRLVAPGKYAVVSGFLSASQVLSAAKDLGLSMTEYVASVLLWCLQEKQERHDAEREAHGRTRRTRPLRLNIPVNLRPLFGSISMRNFFCFADPAIDPRLGLYTFEEIADHVRAQLRFQVQERRMRLMISRNVRGEQPLITRLIPVQFKDIVLGFVYRFLGDRRFSMSLSNMGKVELPSEIGDRVQSFIFLPPPNPVSKTNCTLVTWKDKLCISFARMIDDVSFERDFFRFFTSRGMSVYVESNRR